jgi:hypothetical protein
MWKLCLTKSKIWEHERYSYFSASTGIMVAARNAGYKPESMPMNVEKISANNGSQIGV